jgi:hypothetical protein
MREEPAVTPASTIGDPSVLTCELCGTRLHRNDEPDQLEVGADSLMTVGRHRCVPRVKTRTIR